MSGTINGCRIDKYSRLRVECAACINRDYCEEKKITERTTSAAEREREYKRATDAMEGLSKAVSALGTMANDAAERITRVIRRG